MPNTRGIKLSWNATNNNLFCTHLASLTMEIHVESDKDQQNLSRRTEWGRALCPQHLKIKKRIIPCPRMSPKLSKRLKLSYWPKLNLCWFEKLSIRLYINFHCTPREKAKVNGKFNLQIKMVKCIAVGNLKLFERTVFECWLFQMPCLWFSKWKINVKLAVAQYYWNITKSRNVTGL